MIYRINRVNILNIWTLYDSAPVKKMLFPFAIWRKKNYRILVASSFNMYPLYIYPNLFINSSHSSLISSKFFLFSPAIHCLSISLSLPCVDLLMPIFPVTPVGFWVRNSLGTRS